MPVRQFFQKVYRKVTKNKKERREESEQTLCYAMHVCQGLYQETSSEWKAIADVEVGPGSAVFIPPAVRQGLVDADMVEVIIENRNPCLKIFFAYCAPGSGTTEISEREMAKSAHKWNKRTCAMPENKPESELAFARVSPALFNELHFDSLILANDIGTELLEVLTSAADCFQERKEEQRGRISIFESPALTADIAKANSMTSLPSNF